MDFDFSPEQPALCDEVETFLDAHDTPDVMDVARENMAQIDDTAGAPGPWPSAANAAGSA